MNNENLFEIKNVSIEYKLRKYSLRAVNDVTLNIKKGKITALVGESGSGKTTLASSLINCISEPGVIVSGEVIYYHDDEYLKSMSSTVDHDRYMTTDIAKLKEKELNLYRWKETSMVFQGAQSSLNPLMTIYDQFYETLAVHKLEKLGYKEFKKYAENKMKEVLQIVNLDYERVSIMYPHELSGGMKQRVMIAFALLLNPKLIILDEPTTALDVITQDYIFRILKRVNVEQGVSMLLLTHDVGIVAKFSDYIGVMYAGQLMEYGTTEEVFEKRYHPYTDGLISATPSLIVDNKTLKSIPGQTPDLKNLPTGCVFNPRCSKCMERCKTQTPKRHYLANGHEILCHLYDKEEQ